MSKSQREEKNKKRKEETLKQLKEVRDRFEKQNKKKKKITDKKEDLEPWGDILTTSKNWPNETEEKTIRIMGQNVNGISYYNKYVEWEMALNYLDEFQVDVAGICELNLDVKKASVKETLYKKLKKIDPHARIVMTTSPSKYSETDFKMGGTAMVTRGNWSGHIQEQGNDKLGRWSYQTLEGKDGKLVTIITMYRVCKKNNNSSGGTIRAQQEKDLLQETGKHLDPREQVLRDLQDFIIKLHGKGHLVILLGDMNDDLQTSSRVNQFLNQSNLKNIMCCKHEMPLPRTHDRGSTCIDLVAISIAMDSNAVIRCGYMPFYEGIATDHRAAYVDISTKYLFSDSAPDTNKFTLRRFTTDNPKKADKYLKKLEEEMEKARIFRKVDELRKEMNQYLENKEGELQDLIKRCKNLSEKTKQLMIHSERKVGRRHYNNGYPSSPKLKEAAQEIIRIKKLMRVTSANDSSTSIPIQQLKRDLKEGYKRLIR